MNMPDNPSVQSSEEGWPVAVGEMNRFVLSLGEVRGAFERMGSIAGVLDAPAANTHRALISLQDVAASYGVWLWTKRNEDKPHRCPRCHTIARRFYDLRIGPRTVLRCLNGCRLQWRYGRVGWRRQVGSPSNSDPLLPWQGWGR